MEISELNDDVLALIILFVNDLVSVARTSRVSKAFHRLASKDQLWKRLLDRDWGHHNAAHVQALNMRLMTKNNLFKQAYHAYLGSLLSSNSSMFDCDSKLREYSLGTSWVSSVAIFDDKNGVPHVLAANNYSGTIMKIWDATLDTVEPVATVKSAHKEGIMDVEVIDHETFASGGNDRAIKIWKWQGDKLVLHQAGTGHTDYVAKVLYIPDRNLVASGSADNTIRLWNLNNAKTPDSHNLSCLHVLKGHTGYIWTLQQLHGGNTLVSAGSDSSIMVWNVDTTQCTSVLKGHTSSIWSSCMLDENVIATGAYDHSIMLWDIRTEKSIHQLKNIHHSDIHCMSAINNIWLVTGGADMRFAFTDLRKLAPVRKTVTPAAPADVSIRRDFAAASLGNGRVHLWKAEFGL